MTQKLSYSTARVWHTGKDVNTTLPLIVPFYANHKIFKFPDQEGLCSLRCPALCPHPDLYAQWQEAWLLHFFSPASWTPGGILKMRGTCEIFERCKRENRIHTIVPMTVAGRSEVIQGPSGVS